VRSPWLETDQFRPSEKIGIDGVSEASTL